LTEHLSDAVVDAGVQAVPSSPLFTGASAKRQADASSHPKSSAPAAADAALSSHEHTTTQDTAAVVKPVQQPPKPSAKQTVKDAVPSKLASSIFADDNDADDLFASPEPSKVHTHTHQSCSQYSTSQVPVITSLVSVQVPVFRHQVPVLESQVPVPVPVPEIDIMFLIKMAKVEVNNALPL